MKTKTELGQRIKEQRSAALIVNTHSRRGEKSYFRALDALQERGFTITASYRVQHPDRLPEVAREIIQQKEDLVIVGGGDGTISSIVDCFAYQEVVLGILPFGTGNSFARTLGIPLTLEGAVDVIVHGKVADVDLGKVDNDYFANIATLGFSADVAGDSSPVLKNFFGPFAYLLAAIKHFFRHRSFSCTLRIDREVYTIKTHQVIIANGSFTGKTLLTPTISLDDRGLIVFTMDMKNRWQMLELWPAFFLGKYHAFSGAKYFQTPAVRFETDPVQRVSVDGEVTTRTPVTVSLAPEALRVMVPQTFEDLDE